MEGKLTVYAPNLSGQLKVDRVPAREADVGAESKAESTASTKMGLSFKSDKGKGGTFKGKTRAEIAHHKAAQEAKFKQLEEQIQKETQRSLHERAKKRDAAFNEMFQSVISGLEGTDPLVNEIDRMIEYSETMKTKKKAMLYEEWRTNVFDKIHAKLQKQLKDRNVEDIESRLRAHYDDFIATSNRKGAVFRDIIIESEYDPLMTRNESIRIDTQIDDPVKRDIRRTEQEKAQAAELLGYFPEDNKAVVRYTLELEMWNKLGVTPHGRFEPENDTPHEGSIEPSTTKKANLAALESRVHMDHYHYKGGVPAVEDKTGKRVVDAPGEDSISKMNGAIFQRMVQHSGATMSGDTWLGNPLVDPCKGRKPLGHSEKEDERRKHDSWIGNELIDPSKGKRYLSAPGGDRGRKDLFALVCQRNINRVNSELIAAGETCGDQWLEARGKAFGKQSHERLEIADAMEMEHSE